jgi:hypothetical protein
MGVCSTGKTYADFLGDHLHATVINAGKSGSCNSRIFRTSIRDLLELQKQDEITAVISLGAAFRSELWRPQIPVIDNDGHFNSFQITSLDKDDKFNSSDQIKFFKEWFKWYNDEAEITNVCTQLIMFVAFLEKNKINYLIWVGVAGCYKEVDTTAPFLNILYDQIKNNPKILNIFNFSFGKFAISKGYIPYDYEEFGMSGHHTEEAHRDFADYLITKL